MSNLIFKNGWFNSRVVRSALLVIAGVAAVGGLGCATMIATESPNPFADSHYHKPVLTDSVYAMAHPDAALSKKMGREGVVAFLGKKHTYLLVEGGDRIEKVAHEIGGARLTLEPGTHQLYRKGDAIWGAITLTYRPDEGPGSPTDPDKMKALGFVLQKPGAHNVKEGDYILRVDIKGVVASAAKLKKAVPDAFDKSRDIAFYNPPDSAPPPDVLKLITVPLGLVVDVALTPVYVLGLLVVSLSM